MSKSLIVIITLLLIALLSFGKYVSVRNTLVSKNEAVKSAWSQVDVVLQRRADLIPNLVETVRGITKQEQTVFGEIAQARSQVLRCGGGLARSAEGELLCTEYGAAASSGQIMWKLILRWSLGLTVKRWNFPGRPPRMVPAITI